MLRMPMGELRPGMRLAKSIMAEDGRVLLFAGTELKETYLKTLQTLGVQSVYVQNELAPDIEVADLVSDQTVQALAVGLKESTAEISRAFRSALRSGNRSFSGGLISARVKNAVEMVVSDILANPRAVINLQDLRTADEETVGHSINACTLATLMGLAAGYNMVQLHEVAMGALMHDIGKIGLPREVLAKGSRLSDQEKELVKQHTKIGWEILSKQPEIAYTSSAVALQHHERYAGAKGYPRGIQGKEIHEYARICMIVDTFDTLVAERPGRRGYPPHRALKVMTELMSDAFDPDLLKLFIECTAPYPVGMMVRISGGYVAVVTATERGKVNRPRIRLLKDPAGAALGRPVELDLAARPEIEILGPVRDPGGGEGKPEFLS